MEGWIDIIKERLQEAETTLPPGDWEAFEAASLPGKRPSVLSWLVPALAAAAAAALIILLKPGSGSETLPEPPVASIERIVPPDPVTVAEALPSVTVPTPSIRKPAAVPAEPAQGEPADAALPEEPESYAGPSPGEEPETAREPVAEHPVHQDYTDTFDAPWDDFVEADAPSIPRPGRRFGVSSRIGGPAGRAAVQSGLYATNGTMYMVNGDDKAYAYYGIDSGLDDYPTEAWTARHSLPLSFGLEVSYFPTRRLALTSGLELSLYRSSFTAPDRFKTNYRQRAYYLGIPLRVDWVAWQAGRFSAWLGAGGKVDRCIYARLGDTSVRDDAFNWSVMADVSLQYALTENLGLYVQPEVSWFFKPSGPALLTYRTAHPLLFTVGAGLRFGF